MPGYKIDIFLYRDILYHARRRWLRCSQRIYRYVLGTRHFLHIQKADARLSSFRYRSGYENQLDLAEMKPGFFPVFDAVYGTSWMAQVKISVWYLLSLWKKEHIQWGRQRNLQKESYIKN